MQYGWFHTCSTDDSIHAVRMQCRSSSNNSKNRECRKYKCLIPFMRCGSRMACGGVAELFSTPWSDSCLCRMASAVERRGSLHFHQFCFVTLDSLSTATMTEVSKSWQPWWRTITNELKLYNNVIGTMFRPLFYGIVQPKALLSFGFSMLFFIFFFTRRGSIAISVCMCMKTA